MIYCSKCGKQNTEDSMFCVGCGAPLSQQTNYKPTMQPGKGFAIASLVCGILSFFCYGIVPGVLAIVFGVVAKNKGCTDNTASAGIVLGIIGIVLYVLLFAFVAELFKGAFRAIDFYHYY